MRGFSVRMPTWFYDSGPAGFPIDRENLGKSWMKQLAAEVFKKYPALDHKYPEYQKE